MLRCLYYFHDGIFLFFKITTMSARSSLIVLVVVVVFIDAENIVDEWIFYSFDLLQLVFLMFVTDLPDLLLLLSF